ncbi:MAG: response regulator [Ectothiorhodospiraceae bacterium]|nr:response regulator [Ectothiorhodospiraceae bacterium]MCH8504199.1 response regulator [Ectothiorhodospiraceae bacterium]
MAYNAHGRRLLVISGEQEGLADLRDILKQDGHEVLAAETESRALGLMRTRRVDAFLLDLGETSDGLQICRSLRAQPGYFMAPLLGITNSSQSDDWQAAFQAGCDDVLRKPIESVILRARLLNLLEKADYASELERVRANLARYVSPRLRQLLQTARAGEGLPAPKEQDVCILFSDIRGFTSLSRTIPAETLFNTVSRHLGFQVESVYAHGGYVDKFGGDGIMAVFDGEDMVHNACACALDIMDTNYELQTNSAELTIPLGIGIHTGPVVAGNIGSGEHLDYTVIGNTVNLAARLCGYARPMDVVVSDAVYRALGKRQDIRCVEPQQAEIRGLTGKVTLYRLEGPSRAVVS